MKIECGCLVILGYLCKKIWWRSVAAFVVVSFPTESGYRQEDDGWEDGTP